VRVIVALVVRQNIEVHLVVVAAGDLLEKGFLVRRGLLLPLLLLSLLGLSVACDLYLLALFALVLLVSLAACPRTLRVLNSLLLF
jgi:hypothetical protein